MSIAATVGAHAPSVTLLDTAGRSRSLDELVDGRPTVLYFLRHYG